MEFPVPVVASVPKDEPRPYVKVRVGGKKFPFVKRESAIRWAIEAVRARGLKVEPAGEAAEYAGLVVDGEAYWGFMRGMRGVANGGWWVWVRAERPEKEA